MCTYFKRKRLAKRIKVYRNAIIYCVKKQLKYDFYGRDDIARIYEKRGNILIKEVGNLVKEYGASVHNK